MALRAVLFDFDGVLVNSEPLHYRALAECLVPEGVEIDENEYLRHYLAYDDREAIRVALERHGVGYDRERVERAARRKAALFDALIGRVPFFPGARELVGALRARFPLGIASGALRGEIEAILRAGGLGGSFAAVVGAEDVARGKPDPEPYLTAVRRLAALAPGLDPSECVVIEDSVPGIASALAAGMKAVGVAHSYPAAKLASAHRVVDSLVGLTPTELEALF